MDGLAYFILGTVKQSARDFAPPDSIKLVAGHNRLTLKKATFLA